MWRAPDELPDAFAPGQNSGNPGDPRGDRTKLPPPDGHPGPVRAGHDLQRRQLRDHRPLRELNKEWLHTSLELPNGIPLHNTLERVFARLDANGFEEGFRDWVQDAFELTDGMPMADEA